MKEINTEKFALFCLVALVFGFVWNTFFPQSPYMLFAEFVSGLFLALAGKRLTQKTRAFQNGQVVCETEKSVEDKQ